MTNGAKTGTVDVNGTKLYYELRGKGPSLFFIPGAEGDAEEYLRVAERLEDDFTVLSYDRRAYSRSPRPAGFTGNVDVEADDAAALLRALDLAPALLWGNSSGAIIGLSLVLRHPEVVRKAMLHEPPLLAGLSDPDGVLDFLKESTANGKVPFLRMLIGDAVYNGFSEGYRTRLEADDTWIRYELNNFEHYRPTDQDLAQVQKPVAVLYGADSPPFFGEAANWLSERLGTEPVTISGGHGSHYDMPEEVAKIIRDLVPVE
ncbi:MAG: alpha/beta hydrolase [Chloroflexi bacterium]|nr:alpha/beta hydrolase [Chloroflexota bacterium]